MQSKTYSPGDFRRAEIAGPARRLRRYALRLGLQGTPFAVNGILRRRFWTRRNKLWEYACGLAFLEEQGIRAPVQGQAAPRILDFGGAGTLPIFYLAQLGFEVLCLDIDRGLSAYTNQLAERCGWKLRASTHNLVTDSAPAEWGRFDAAVSFSVLEHLAKPEQAPLLARVAALLRPGGGFALTFDFGEHAPQPNAVRTLEEVSALVSAARLSWADGVSLKDTGERFALDKRHPGRLFTFASCFLLKK